MSTFEDNEKKKVKQRWVIGLGVIAIILAVVLTRPNVQTKLYGTYCRTNTTFGNSISLVPHGSPWSEQRVFRTEVPSGYKFALGWITAATDTQCLTEGDRAEVYIDVLRVIAIADDGSEEVVYEEDFDGINASALEGALYRRYPEWFKGDFHEDFNLPIRDGSMVIDLSQASQNIAHLWTPRLAVRPGDAHIIEVEMIVFGRARIQFGVDYWIDATSENNGFDEFCRSKNNCEAWVSAWTGDTNGQSLRMRAPL